MVNFDIVFNVYFLYNVVVMAMEKLKNLRINQGYTIAQMAELVGLSPTYYWQIENKKRRLYYEIAARIAKVFNLKPDDIFFDDF